MARETHSKKLSRGHSNSLPVINELPTSLAPSTSGNGDDNTNNPRPLLRQSLSIDDIDSHNPAFQRYQQATAAKGDGGDNRSVSSSSSNNKSNTAASKFKRVFRSFVRRHRDKGVIEEARNLGSSSFTSGNEGAILFIAMWCIDRIESADDSDLTAIYLSCGDLAVTSRLQLCFERKKVPHFCESPHSAADLLKRYFRNFQEPLFSESLYGRLMMAYFADDDQYRLVSLQQELKALPPAKYQLAKVLFYHLARLCKRRSLVNVTPKTLALSWAPNLFAPASYSFAVQADTDSTSALNAANCALGREILIVESIIEHAETLFK